MISYVMQAKENYPSDIAARLNADDVPVILLSDQLLLGTSYDRLNRRLMYLQGVAETTPTTTNATGHTIWNGATAVAPGDPYETDVNEYIFKDLFVTAVSVATGTVTSYPWYSASKLVPTGIGGGDGTWRRYGFDMYSGGKNLPALTSPYTGDFWVSAGSCELYQLRSQDAFALAISPLFPTINPNAHIFIYGVTETWAYAIEHYNASNNEKLYLVPAQFTADEIAADYLLAYATYTMPSAAKTSYYNQCMDQDGNLWFIGVATTSGIARNWFLWKFTPPSAFVYPTPPIDGGVTDETPWTSSTGPNTDVSSYLYFTYYSPQTQNINNQLLMHLPASNHLVAITKLFAGDMLSSDPNDTRFDCTYIDIAGTISFDYHKAFVTGYMTSAWSTTSDPNAAAWSVLDCNETNTYLNVTDYVYSDDYTSRWFFFYCHPVSGGVVDSSQRKRVLVKYQFVAGGAPIVSQVIDESGWDSAYSAYGTAISNPNVVDASMVPPTGTYFQAAGAPQLQTGVWDSATSAWWWSGLQQNMFQLNSAFTNRAAFSAPSVDPPTIMPPLLRLSLGTTTRFRALSDEQQAWTSTVAVTGSPPSELDAGSFAGGVRFTAIGGAGGPYVYTDGGTLPQGMFLNSVTGVATGTPEVSGTYEVIITATDPKGGSGSYIWDLTVPGAAPVLAPVNIVLPVITGTTTEGFTLSTSNGLWENDPTSYAYQWKRDGLNIVGQIASTYLLATADVGKSITCAVTASNTGGDATATSLAVGPIAAASSGSPVNTVAPVVSGSTIEGQTLSVSNGTWTNSPTGYTYQWKRDGVVVVGATASTYLLGSGDVGSLISCAVTASNGSGSNTAPSNSIGPISAPAAQLAPSSQWDGTAGSGFGGVYADIPIDPPRVTAKPWCRPLFPNWLKVLDDATIGVDAGALGGLSSVTFVLEGNSLTVTSEALHSYTDVNGDPQSIYGYLCTFDHATWIALNANGEADLYIVATANDGTMQQRVMGPYTFYARSAEFTVTKTVGASGADYTNIKDALTYARTNPTQRVQIQLIDNGANYRIDTQASTFASAKWWTTITAAPGVTATLGDGSLVYTQPAFDGLEIRGDGIIFNIAKLGYNLSSAWRFSNGTSNRLWLNGCQVVGGTPDPAHGGSGTGSASLINGNQPGQFWIGGNDPTPDWNVYYTEVAATGLAAYGLSFCQLRRNSTAVDVSGSDCENTICVHGGYSDQVGGYYSGLRTEQGAFDLTGPVGGAYEKTGANGSSGAFNVYDVAGNPTPTHTFPLSSNTTMSALIAAINGWAGYSATPTASTNALSATYLSRPDLSPASSIPKTTFSGTASLTRIADIHADVIVHHTYLWENGCERFHENRRSVGTAHISVNGDQPMKDWGTRNVSNQDVSASVSEATQPGYWGGVRSHVVCQYGSDTNPSGNRFLSGSTSDTYCDVDHWAGAITIAAGSLANQRLTSLACPTLPTGADANSKVVSSDQTLLFTSPNANPPDFTPLSPLQLADTTWAGRYLPDGSEQGE